MTGDRPAGQAAIDASIARATDFEVSLMALTQRSERRAWSVALAALVVVVLAVTAVWLLLPLKERVPYLVLTDAGTGRATLTRLSDDPESHAYSSHEAVARAHVAQFVRARESYELSELGERDWNTVFAMAGQGTREAYAALHSANNPKAPHKIHGTAASIRVQILSLQLSDPSAAGAKIATVRFQRTLHNNGTGDASVLEHRIATLQYSYQPALTMSDATRLLNPLGFSVTAYRADDDQVPVLPGVASQGPLS